MILLSTALMMEARPLVERLELSACGNEPIRTYTNETFILMVTGTGGIRAATAIGWAHGRFPDIRATVNIGFCGAAPEVAPMHQWHYINSIRDAATRRLSIPDILWKHGLPEAGLLTSPKVVDSPIEEKRLVDMEGSGFFEAARQFLSPDAIALLKWVSDPLTGRIEAEKTARDYEKTFDPVIEFLKNWPAGEDKSAPDESTDWYESIVSRLRLSESQSHYMKKWLTGYGVRGGDPLKLFDCLPEKSPTTKRENTIVFERLKDVIKS